VGKRGHNNVGWISTAIFQSTSNVVHNKYKMSLLLVVFQDKHLNAIKDAPGACIKLVVYGWSIVRKKCTWVIIDFYEQITHTKKNKKAFDGTIEKRRAPKIHNGKHMFMMVKDLKVVLRKGKGGGSKKTKKAGKNAEKNAKNNGNETSVLFKKRSIFWNLPYWKDLMVCHAIDVMHVEKNVCKSLVGTLLDIPSKTKDTLKACMDLEEMKLRRDLHHETLKIGSKKLPTACYTLSKQEKMSLCNCLYGIKVLASYLDNVSGMVNMKYWKYVSRIHMIVTFWLDNFSYCN
jgi:hypothetical protein